MPHESFDVIGALESARAQIATLTGERDALRTQLTAAQSAAATAQAEVTSLRAVAEERGEAGELASMVRTMGAELTAARAQIANLTAGQQDFDTKVRQTVVKYGIRTEALPLIQKADVMGADGAPSGETITQKAQRMMKEGHGGKIRETP